MRRSLHAPDDLSRAQSDWDRSILHTMRYSIDLAKASG
jgi:hypothetical protein